MFTFIICCVYFTVTLSVTGRHGLDDGIYFNQCSLHFLAFTFFVHFIINDYIPMYTILYTHSDMLLTSTPCRRGGGAGSPEYISPEVLEKKLHGPSVIIDLF